MLRYLLFLLPCQEVDMYRCHDDDMASSLNNYIVHK